MCRFLMYLGPEVPISSLVTEPAHSLIHQSYQARERTEPLNGDGFGIAWYAPAIRLQPGLFRSVSPAWNNQNLRHLAKMIQSGCILAHIRAATVGLVSQANCHPFVYGHLTFMHNGEVAGFERIERALRRRLSDEAYSWIEGSTDTEHTFALFIDEWRRRDGQPAAARMRDSMRATIATIEELCDAAGVVRSSLLNLVATDGTNAVVTRYASGSETPASLYVERGSAHRCEDGLYVMEPGEPLAAVVASEPLTVNGGWERVAENQMLIFEGPSQVTHEAI